MKYQKNGTPGCKYKDCGKTFQVYYLNNSAKPETKKMIIKMSINGSGIRDTDRVLNINDCIIILAFKK